MEDDRKSKKEGRSNRMDAIRRSLRVLRMDRIRNEDLKERMGVKKTVIEDIEERQLIWCGQARAERLHKQVWE